MKKLKNKFILALIFAVLFIFASQVYRAYSSGNTDTNSYLSLLRGKASLNDNFIDIEKKYQIQSGDTLRTIGEESLALIEWGDGSVTRLGGDTKISIENNEVTRDYSRITISFDLIAGKTWSNVISFIGKDSSFTQKFEGVEAGVRGTTFDVDLEKDFVNVSDHQVILKKDGKQQIVSENQVFSLSSFSFVELSKYIAELRDTAWTEINTQYDGLYFEQLEKNLQDITASHNPLLFLMEIFGPKWRFLYELDMMKNPQKLEELFALLSPEQKQALLPKIQTAYQKLNFVKPDDTENYERKIVYKKMLLELSDPSEKEVLLQYSLYDLQDALKSKSKNSLESTLSLLSEHTDIVKTLNFDFLKDSFDIIPDGLEESMREEFQTVKGFIGGGIPQIPSLSSGKDTLDAASEVLKGGKEKVEENIHQSLDTLFETLTQ